MFDYDDTIVAARSHRRNALVTMIESQGRTPDHDGFDRAYGDAFRELIAAVDPGVDVSTFLDQYTTYIEENPADLLPGVRELVHTLSRIGRPLGIVSTSNTRLIRAELRAHGLEQSFAYIAGEDSPEPRKPNPEVLRIAARAVSPGSEVASAVYIGDSLVDYRMACQAGSRFIGVCTGQVSRDTFRSSGVPSDLVINDLTALVRRLERET